METDIETFRRNLNRTAFERFDAFLTLRRQAVQGEDGTDIRARMLELRSAAWAVGYATANLKTGYAAHLDRLWPKLFAIEDPRIATARYRMMTGTLYSDPLHSHLGSQTLMRDYQPNHQLVLAEQGFLASTHSWSEAMQRKDPAMGCLGYVYDDIAYYFMADYPNRLIHRLNSDHALGEAEIARARRLIDRIVATRISKYNSQPLSPPTMAGGYTRRVLVVDQTFADASTLYGRIDEAGFEAMLLAALAENPDAEILVKTHPDTAWEPGKRTGYYSHLRDTARVRVLRAPVSPYLLFERVDKVYVGTSQMGLEALFAGLDVVCFGAPFYAGWGLTDDRQEIPHRHRTRSLEELFYYFYIWYTLYHVPGAGAVPSEIDDALDYIEAHRPVAPPRPKTAAHAAPKVSVIIPVYAVEPYIEACLTSVQAQSLTEIEIITINDHSPDQSQAVIDQLAAEDPRIRPIFLDKNVGQGFARNIGLEAARGDYVWFLDSDDFMPAVDHLQQVYDCAVADQADMVRGRKVFEQIEDAKGNIEEMRRDRSEFYFDRPFHGTTLIDTPHVLRSRHFYNWLYRRDFLEENGIRFLTAQWEERPFLLRALLSATSISSTTSEALVYRIRQDSTARRPKSTRDSFNQLANLEQVSAVLEEFGAYQPDSPLRYAAGFMLMQSLHILFNGFAYRTMCQAENADDLQQFLARISTVLAQSGFGFDDMVFDAPQLSPQRRGTHSYRLLFEALRLRRYGYIDIALNETPLPQADVMAALLEDPSDADAAAWQTALSLYARNERVSTATGLAPLAQKPRLVLHVGQTKTGSTYIQHFLEQNRPALLRAGVWVPDTGLFWQENRPHKQAGHGHVTHEAVTGGRAIRDHIEAALSLAEGRIHTVILSSEAYFLNRRAALIPDHFAGYPTEVIGYFRRQDDWANSQYAEFVAGGAMGRVSESFEAWLDDPVTRLRLDYFSYCQMWATRLGPENVHVRLYDRDRLKEGDVVSDFLETLGLGALADLPRPDRGRANDLPFNSAHVHLLRGLNALDWGEGPAYLDFIQDAGDRVAALRGDIPAGPAQVITPAQRRALLADLAASNASFAETFCDGATFAPLEAPSGAADEASLSALEIAVIHETRECHTPDAPDPEEEAASPPPPPGKPLLESVEQLAQIRGLLLDLRNLPEKTAPGGLVSAELTLFNLSAYQIPTQLLGQPVTLSYHILDAEGRPVIWDGRRSLLRSPVEHQYSGALRIEAPPEPGMYQIQAGLVFEGQRWFDSRSTWAFPVG